MKNFKLAFIIGFGRMGQRHAKALELLNVGSVRVFDCDTSISNKTQYNIESVDRLSDNLIKTTPDLVIISTNADTHLHYLSLCVKHKVPYILCEKPLCRSVAELEEIQLIQNNNPELRIAVNHQIRYFEPYSNLKKIVDSKKHGDLISINISAGNMGAAMNFTHYFELFRFLTNLYPSRVHGWLGTQSMVNPRGDNYSDFAGSVRVINDSGQFMTINSDERQGHGIIVTYAFERAQLVMDEIAGIAYCSSRMKDYHDFPSSRYGCPADNHILRFGVKSVIDGTAALLRAMLSNGSYPTLEDGIMTVKTLMGALHSSYNGNIGVSLSNTEFASERSEYAWA